MHVSEYLVQEVSAWTDVVYVDSSSRGVLAIKKDGSLLKFIFDNGAFENADFSQFTDLVSINLEYRAAFGLRKDGTVIATGYQCEHLNEWMDVVAIANNDMNYDGIRSDGKIYGYHWELDEDTE